MFKNYITLLVIITTIASTQAQDVWNDYVIGRPMVGYFEAKKAVAKEWGINYNTDMAGCIVSDETDKKIQEYEKSNAPYFKKLETQFGKDWMRYFSLDVQKKMLIAEAQTDSSYWIETVVGKPNITYFETKEVVAKTWGINYKADFAGCNMSEELMERIKRGDIDSDAYQRRLTARFGENWQEILEQEIQLEQAKKNASTNTTTSVWKEYVKGTPDKAYYDTKKSIAAKWGITYEPVFMGCKCNNKVKAELKSMDEKNKAYWSTLQEQYGENWKMYFEIEVQKVFSKSNSK